MSHERLCSRTKMFSNQVEGWPARKFLFKSFVLPSEGRQATRPSHTKIQKVGHTQNRKEAVVVCFSVVWSEFRGRFRRISSIQHWTPIYENTLQIKHHSRSTIFPCPLLFVILFQRFALLNPRCWIIVLVSSSGTATSSVS